MTLISKLISGLVAITFVFCATSESNAHMAFKKRLEAKYEGMKVSCNACHVKKKPKTERNEFGKLFHKQWKETHAKLTEEWKSKKGAEKKAYETEVMVPTFDKALKVVKEMKNDKKEKYDDLIKAGKIPEITHKKPKK